MNHGNKVNRLGRNAKHRKAMLRTMVTQLLRHERIETTLAKAKVLRQFAERMITIGKNDNVVNRRAATSFIRSQDMVNKVFTELSERYRYRPGGYTRVLRSRIRKDSAVMAYIELVDRPGELRPAAACGPDYAPNPVPRRNFENRFYSKKMLEEFEDPAYSRKIFHNAIPEEILQNPQVTEDPYEDPKAPLL